jgi:hypothetical protein
MVLGAVFDPEDVAKNRRKIFQNAMKDMRPETKDRIIKIFGDWKGRASEKELEELLGGQRTKKFRELVDNSSDELSSDEVENLRRLFRESLTFD